MGVVKLIRWTEEDQNAAGNLRLRKNGSDPSPAKDWSDSDDAMTSNNTKVNRLNLDGFEASPGKKEAMRLETCLNRDEYKLYNKAGPDYAQYSHL